LCRTSPPPGKVAVPGHVAERASSSLYASLLAAGELHPWQFELVGHAARDSNGCAVQPGEKQVETVISGRSGTGSPEVQRELRRDVRHHPSVQCGGKLLGGFSGLTEHE